MSATELATVVEGWATLAGLIVVITGAAFAGVQLYRESQARRLQALVALYADVWPVEANREARIVMSLPDGFEYESLQPGQQDAIRDTAARFERLGFLLKMGAVRGEEIFRSPPFGRAAIAQWEKLKHALRGGGGPFGQSITADLPGPLHFEYLAWRAQQYLLRHGVEDFGAIPVFDADWDALSATFREAQQARAKAR